LNIRPNAAFSVQWTAAMIFIVVIGGIGTVEGPIIGAILFTLVRENLATIMQEYLPNAGEWSIILLGAVAMAMMLVAPQGIWGLLRQRLGWAIFPAHRLMPAQPLSEDTQPSASVEGAKAR
jgi:branched-chain amino acid transport system permease protein